MSPELADSPAEDLLPEILKGLHRKWLSEYVGQLFLGFNPFNSDLIIEMRAEPMNFDIIELGTWSVPSRVQIGKDAS